jgi:hypothetical protein
MTDMLHRLCDGMGKRWVVAAALLVALGCGDNTVAPTVQLLDRDRYARFTADGQSIVYYRQDERPGGTNGIYRLDLASGDVHLLVEVIPSGLDLHPQTDSIVFSGLGVGEAEPALWLMGLDGGGVRRLGGGGNGPGFRWPAFSPDGARIAWEVRRQNDPDLDVVNTLWIGEWQGGTIVNAHAVAPGRRSMWRPDGAAFVVERRRAGGALPLVIALMDTTGRLLDTLGFGSEPVWRPDGAMVAYLADIQPDRGCLGVCFVSTGGGSPVPLSTGFMSFPGSWSAEGGQFVFARLMRTYEIAGDPAVSIEESRLWIRALATGADRQLTF